MKAFSSESSNLIKLALLVVVAILAAFALAVVVKVEPSQAAFPGQNGKIAFVSDRDGNFEIYVMNPDGSNQTNITNNAAPDRKPAWSPDGTKIAFDRNGEIYTMNADGSNQTNVTNNAVSDFHPTWSPDGTKIGFVSGRDGNFEIYTMNADGSNQTNISNNAARDHDPAWSPDGTRIAFVSDRGGNEEIHTINADGSGVTLLRDQDPEHDGYDTDPTWSPDGTKIAFESGDWRSEYGPHISVIDADGSPADIGLSTGEEAYDPSWSPDGTKIAFTDCLNGCEIYTVNLDGSNETNISSNAASDLEPDWQPTTNTAPFITSLRPPPGSTTTDRTPTIAATVTDQQTNLAKSNITLFLNDVTIPRTSFSFNRTTDRMTYTPASDLSLGKHALKVIARDASGLSTTKRWSFTIAQG